METITEDQVQWGKFHDDGYTKELQFVYGGVEMKFIIQGLGQSAITEQYVKKIVLKELNTPKDCHQKQNEQFLSKIGM